MCTVTYIPSNSNNPFVLTVNRDEKEARPTLPPQIHQFNGKDVLYPADQLAGGSWIAVNKNNKITCLLNGGFTFHQKQKYHTISRGTVLTDFTASDLTVYEFFSGKDLSKVEPFTIISITHDKKQAVGLTEFIWNGDDKHFRVPDKNKPHIWSSATLYDEEQRKLRQQWFKRFLAEEWKNLSPEKVLAFHTGSYTNNKSIDVVMQRQSGISTVSITQVIPKKGKCHMSYNDLLNNSVYEAAI
ncbi:MAG: hypothetical protein GVY19_05820 [Bacteroidetes bacterium]|jgi:hypothetical protein|nr:hypothetical protein [Bacteroidota bacterium]